MKRFPIVEDLITVVDDAEVHAEQPRSKQQQTCNSGADGSIPFSFWLRGTAPNIEYIEMIHSSLMAKLQFTDLRPNSSALHDLSGLG